MAETEKYFLFLDECGDHSLSQVDPCFGIFTLCGVLINEKDYQEFCNDLSSIKLKYWGENKKIIFHSRDIRKCQKGFEILFNLNVKKEFYESLNSLMLNTNYKIITTNILKENYIKKFGKMNDVYAVSLSSIIERTIIFLDDLKNKKKNDIKLEILVERRGEKEDKNLLKYYNELCDLGSYYAPSQKMKEFIDSFHFKWKKDDIAGLQLADLLAYPIANFVLDKNSVNLAFDVIKDKIMKMEDEITGICIFP